MPLAAKRDPQTERKDGPHLVVGAERVGVTLRRAREDFGQDLKSVSAGLRIRHVYLEAIEAGHFEKLPGPTYAVGFVRAYSDYLGLDTDEILRRFKEEVHGLERKTNLVFPSAVPEKKIPGGAIILVSVLLAGVAYGAWMYLSNQGKEVGDIIPSVAESIRGLTGREEPATETPPAAGSDSAPVAQDPGAGSSAPAEVAVAQRPAAPSPPPTAAPPAARPEPAPAPAVAPAAAPAVVTPPPAEVPPQPTIAAQEAPTLAEAAQAAGAVSPPPPAFDPVSPPSAPSSLPAIFGATGDQQALLPGSETGSLPPGAEDIEPPAAEIEENAIPAVPAGSGGSTTGEAFATSDVPRVYGESNYGARVVVRARQDAWVQIQDSDSSLLLTRVLRPGDSYLVPNRNGITLLTGNAGGLEILVDGRPIPPLGPIGSVRREISLDAERLLNGTAATR